MPVDDDDDGVADVSELLVLEEGLVCVETAGLAGGLLF